MRYYNNNTEKSSQQATRTKRRESHDVANSYGKLFLVTSGKRSRKKREYLHHPGIDFKSAYCPKKHNCRKQQGGEGANGEREKN